MSKARQTVYTDPGKNLDLVIRKSRNATLTFRFFDTDGNPLTVEDDFSFAIKRDNRASGNLLYMTTNDDLEREDNELRVPFTESNTNLDVARECYWELVNLTSKKNYVQARAFIITGESPEQSTTEANITINNGDTVVNVSVTLGGGGFDPGSATEEQLQELAIDLITYLHPTADRTTVTADNTIYKADNN